MSADVNALYHEKGKVWDEYRATLAQYGDNEEISPEDKLKLDRLNKQFDNIKTMTELREKEAGMQEFYTSVDETKRLSMNLQNGDQAGKIDFNTNSKESKDVLEAKQFNAMLRGGALKQAQRHVPEEWLPFLEGKVALNRTTDAQGGFITPDIYIREFVQKKYAMSFVRQAPVRVFQGTSDVMRIPAINAATAAAVLTTEGSAFHQAEPTIQEIVFTAYKYTRIELASEELVADAGFDLMNEVVLPDLAQAFAAAENTALTTGTGSSQPQGIVTGATSTAAATGNSTSFTADQLITHFHRLPVQYRNSGQNTTGWMMADATVLGIRLLKEATTNQYLWQPGLQASVPDRFLGYPIYVNNAMPVMAANAKSVLFGDFQGYRIMDRLSLAVNTLTERYAELGQIAFRGQSRFDGRVTQPEMLQVLANSAT